MIAAALEPSLYTPNLITITIESCLALACLGMWLIARDFRVFLTLGSYCAMVGLQLLLTLEGLPTAALSALALTAPIMIILACQAMRISMRYWLAAVWAFCLIVAVLCWFPIPAWVAYLPVTLTQILFAALIVIGFTRKDAVTRWIACSLLLTWISRSAVAPTTRAITHLPRDFVLFGLHWYFGPIGSILMAIFTLAIFTRRLMDDRRTRQQLEAELEAARAIQQMLVSGSAPTVPGYQFEAVYQAFGQVGGDFYQVLPVHDGTLIVIGDVSGKGISAAMTVSLIVGVVRIAAESESSPAQLLRGMNRALVGRTQGFTTCLLLRFSAPTVR